MGFQQQLTEQIHLSYHFQPPTYQKATKLVASCNERIQSHNDIWLKIYIRITVNKLTCKLTMIAMITVVTMEGRGGKEAPCTRIYNVIW